MFSVPVTGNTIRLDTTPRPDFQPRLIAHLREIPEVVPFPVYLLWEVPDMKEWLLPVALGSTSGSSFTLF
jgi:hypothetical protein